MGGDSVEFDKFVFPNIFDEPIVGNDVVAVFTQQIEDIALVFSEVDDFAVSYKLFGCQVKGV